MANRKGNEKYIGVVGFGEMGKRLAEEQRVISTGMIKVEAGLLKLNKCYKEKKI